MINLSVNKQGIVYGRNPPTITDKDGEIIVDVPDCLLKVRNKELWYSSFWWLPEILRYYSIGITDVENHQNAKFWANFSQRSEDFKKGINIYDSVHDYYLDIKPWKCQRIGAAVLYTARKYYLGDLVGLGKSLTAFMAYLLHKDCTVNKNDQLFIVCLASLTYQWKYEINTYLKEQYHDQYESVVIEGTKKLDPYFSDAPIKIVSWESYTRICLKYPKEMARFRPECVILDEAQKIINTATKAYSAITKLTRHAKCVWPLSSSVIINGPDDIYGPVSAADSRVFLQKTFFTNRYVEYPVPGKYWIKRHVNKKDLTTRARRIILRRTPKEVHKDLPSLIAQIYWVDLTVKQKKDIDRIRKDKKDDRRALANLVRRACLSSKNVPPKDSPKYKELVRFIKEDLERNQKFLIFSDSRQYLQQIEPLLKKEKLAVGMIRGGMTSRAKTAVQHALDVGTIRGILCTPAGEAGLNLQASDVVINLDLPWTGESLRQRVGRLRPYLGGKGRTVRVINILARDSGEQRVINKVVAKFGHVSEMFKEENAKKLLGILNQKEAV